MRADRLLALLMLLQLRGSMTARELAEELEVSERTIYRDLEALSLAGVPVIAERGPGGGCALAGGYRTTLTGLTESERRALFMLSVPAPLVELGVSGDLRSALLKVFASLPAAGRAEMEFVRQRVHLDTAWWHQTGSPNHHLRTVQSGVWSERCLRIGYRRSAGTWVEVTRLVEPYGLVAKAGAWYVVYSRRGRFGVHRIAELTKAELTDVSFERDVVFDLASFWSSWCKSVEESRPSYPVTAKVSPELVPLLPLYFGQAIATRDPGPPRGADTVPENWATVILPFGSFEEARSRVLGFGRAVWVIEPRALRSSVVDFARQIIDLHDQTRPRDS